MITLARMLLGLALPCVLMPLAAAQTRTFLKVGDKAPPLNCSDVNGANVSWDQWDKLAVIVYFHAEQMAYSKQGLKELQQELKKDAALQKRLAILVVSRSDRDLDQVKKGLRDVGVPSAITVDPDRSRFRAFRVVAFPTVFFVNADRRITYVRKGYGPVFPTQVVAAARLSAGMIDLAAFKKAIAPKRVLAKSGNQLMVARTVRMARQLVTAGMLADARKSLEGVMTADSDSAEGVALLAKVLLLQKQIAAAKPWITRLDKLAPKSRDLRVLRAMLLLEEKKPAEAERQLEPLDGRQLEIALLRGRALEQRGRFKEAAALYRRALQSKLEKAN